MVKKPEEFEDFVTYYWKESCQKRMRLRYRYSSELKIEKFYWSGFTFETPHAREDYPDDFFDTERE